MDIYLKINKTVKIYINRYIWKYTYLIKSFDCVVFLHFPYL